ncbi:hypothetical protein GCM10027589_59560 [Actinocorallia lasiicapitis]
MLAGDTPVLVHNANPGCGLGDDAVADAYQGMNKGGGHAMRYLIQAGLLPVKGSDAARRELFESLTSSVLKSPDKTFSWKIGGTQSIGYAGKVNGKVVVLFVATDGPYIGKVVSAVVPTAKNMQKWGLW